MTMFNITDGNNNISRDKPVEHIDMVIGLHVSACTSCTRTMRVRRDIAIDITESVQLLVRFNALRSMPVMPKLEHYNVDALHSMAAAALATQAAAANARARPRLAGQCEKWLARPNTQMPCLHWAAPPPSPCPYMRPHNCPHNCPHARPRTPANVAWCVCTNVRTFSPQVRRRSGRRRLMPVPVGLLPIRPPGLPPLSRTRDPVPRCLGWLATHWVRARLRAPLNPPSSAPARRAPREKGL